ncbi:hypothetical protein OROGR_004639 [Orobanche gracilis]
MVLHSYSAVTEEGKVAEPPPPLPLLEDLMGEVNRLPLDASVVHPPKAPWSMVAIRNLQDECCNNPFPPINHENLQISTDPQPPNANQIPHIHAVTQQPSFSDSDSVSISDSNSVSSFSPSDSSPFRSSPLFPNHRSRPAIDAAEWFYSWMEMLYSKVSSLVRLYFRSFTSSREVFLTSRPAALTAILIAFLYFRRRRRLRAGEVSRGRLIGIIKERDEKISQLLDQISRMNQVMLSLHRVPTSSGPILSQIQ